MSDVAFEDSILGRMILKHKLGCMLPTILVCVGAIAFVIYKNWDTIKDMM